MIVIGALVLIIVGIGVYMMTQQTAGTGTDKATEEINTIEESLNAFESEALTEPDFSQLVPEENFS